MSSTIATAQAQTGGAYTQIATGPNSSFALRSDGQIWAWGVNSVGQLGDGSQTTRSTPVRVSTPTTAGAGTQWTQVSAGGVFTLALRSDGTLWSWGSNTDGQLGRGNVTTQTANNDALQPVAVLPAASAAAGTSWTSISAGYAHVLALRSDGTLWSWGTNQHGELGTGTTAALATSPQPVATPASAASGTTWAQCAAGSLLSFAIRSDGTLWSWGKASYPSFSALGHPSPTAGTFTPELVPAPAGAAAGTVWTAVATGGSGTHTLALRSDGTLWAWGWDAQGELGQWATPTPNGASLIPLQVMLPPAAPTGTQWVRAAVGEHASFGLLNDGSLWGWGLNQVGQLGLNVSGINQALPTQEYNHETWSTVATSYIHSLGISRGQIYVTGSGGNGQLGLGNNQTSLSLFVRIAALPLASANTQLVHQNLYPNPAIGGELITANSLPAGSQVEVYNSQGQRVATCKLTSASQFQLPFLATGLYLLQFIQTGKLLATSRLAID